MNKIPTKKVIVYTDGGARGNPGPAGAGAYITDGDGVVLKEVSKYLGETTNNVAEYQAVILALNAIQKMFGQKTSQINIEMRMDSQLVERQLNGIYRVKDPGLKIFFEKIQVLQKEYFPHIEFTHVRREQNKEADRLANEAMDRGT